MLDNFYIYCDCSMRCSCRTTRGCRPYQSSHAGCRFGHSGSSGSVVGFRRLRLSSRGLVLKVRSCRGRCRYRYTCRPNGFPVRDGCRPKRIQWHFRGRLKLLRFLDDLTTLLGFNPVYACQEI